MFRINLDAELNHSIEERMEKNGKKDESEKKLLEENEIPSSYRGKASVLERKFFL